MFLKLEKEFFASEISRWDVMYFTYILALSPLNYFDYSSPWIHSATPNSQTRWCCTPILWDYQIRQYWKDSSHLLYVSPDSRESPVLIMVETNFTAPLHLTFLPCRNDFDSRLLSQLLSTSILITCLYKRILYFSALGTLLITNRPSYDSDANTQGSAVDHSTAYTLSSCSSNVAMTPSFVGSRDLETIVHRIEFITERQDQCTQLQKNELTC